MHLWVSVLLTYASARRITCTSRIAAVGLVLNRYAPRSGLRWPSRNFPL